MKKLFLLRINLHRLNRSHIRHHKPHTDDGVGRQIKGDIACFPVYADITVNTSRCILSS